MNKKEAATHIGISTRALERHMSNNRLAYSTRRGKTGDEAYFEASEVERFRIELYGDKPHNPAVVSTAPNSPEGESRHLARLSNGSAPETLVQLLAAAIQQAGANNHAAVSVPLADKLTLSLVEAAHVSGLSRRHLREAIEAKKLKARIIGRGWRVKREDLEAYIKKL